MYIIVNKYEIDKDPFLKISLLISLLKAIIVIRNVEKSTMYDSKIKTREERRKST